MMDSALLIGKTLSEAEVLRTGSPKSWTIVETEGKLRGNRTLMDARIIRVIEHGEHFELLVSYF